MVKKNNGDLKGSLPGILSTVVITMIILSVGYFGPWVIANEAEKGRSGSGRYTPQENLIWDFSTVGNFEDVKFELISQNEQGSGFGQGGIIAETNVVGTNEHAFWKYLTELPDTNPGTIHNGIGDGISIVDIPNPKTVEEYGVYSFTPDAVDESETPDYIYPHIEGDDTTEGILLYFNIDVDKMVNDDATRIDFYFNCSELDIVSDPNLKVLYRNTDTEYEISSDVMTIGDITEITITAGDLLQIAGMKDEKEYLVIYIELDSETETFTDVTIMTFDLQVYGLESKTPTVNRIAVWFIGYSLLLVFMSLLMLPQISMKDITDLFRGIGKKK